MPGRLLSSLNALKPLNAVVIGDMILDRFVWGKVDRVSPEAPIPILKVISEEPRMGGAANVAANLAMLGARVSVIGHIGTGVRGKSLRALMKKAKLNIDGLLAAGDKPTIVKTRMIAHNQQVMRIDREEDKDLSVATVSKLKAAYDISLKTADVVVISDYNKRTLSEGLIKHVIDRAVKKGITVIVDPKGKDFMKYRDATAITPNELEAEIATKEEIKCDGTLLSAARQLLKKLRLEYILVTRGEKGMTLLKKNGKLHSIDSKPKTVFDVTGAGDTTLAVFALAVGSGLDPTDAADLANLAAGIVVGKLGTGTVTREEIFHAIFENHYGVPAKIKRLNELSTIIQGHKKEKKTIVFTNGCFDLLHMGHIKSIQFAKSQGDILVVAINSDVSVKKLKGENRPIISEKDRAHILAAIEDIDYITIFNEETPMKTIKKLQPDIIVKGSDWKGKRVVGESFIKAYGGEIAFAPFVKGFSTTDIVDTISRMAENGRKK